MSFIGRGKNTRWPVVFVIYGPYVFTVGVIAMFAIGPLIEGNWSPTGPLGWPLYGTTGLFFVLGGSVLVAWALAFLLLRFYFEIGMSCALAASVALAISLMVIGREAPADAIHKAALIILSGGTSFFAMLTGGALPFCEGKIKTVPRPSVFDTAYPALSARPAAFLKADGSKPEPLALPSTQATRQKLIPSELTPDDDNRRLPPPNKRLR